MQVEAKYIVTREEWLQWRMQDVTGSDLGALAGADKYKSPRKLYEEKVAGVVDMSDNAVLQRGRSRSIPSLKFPGSSRTARNSWCRRGNSARCG